jgi:dTDP-4-dehydrorhamnose reductase
MPLHDSILITGGRGMLAHAFQDVLRARGLRATVVGRDECDVAEPRQVRTLFERLEPTLLINCAAYTKVDMAEKDEQAWRSNSVGPAVLTQASQRFETTLVHFSTDYVFDGSLRRPLRSDDPVKPQSAYGRSKLEGEQAIQSVAPPRWLIVRTAWLYGPNGPNFVDTMLKAARGGRSLQVVNDQVGSPTYTFDLAAATLDLLDRGASGIYHVTNAGQTTWFEFAKAIFEEWGLNADVTPINSAQWKATKPDSATRPAYSVLDLGPLEKVLGRPMRLWREALREYRLSDSATPS